MSADFNAGSIEGSVTLNLTPFRQGLREAKRQADEFQKTKIEPKVTLDTTQFFSEKLRVEAAVNDLGNDSATVNVQIDTSGAMAKLALLKAAMNSVYNHPTSAASSGIFGAGRGIAGTSGGHSIIRGAENAVGAAMPGGSGRGGGFLGGLIRRFDSMGGNPLNSKSGLGRLLDMGGATSFGVKALKGVASAAMPIGIGVLGAGIASLGPALMTAATAAGTFGAAAVGAGAVLMAGIKGYSALVKQGLKAMTASSTGAAGAAYRSVQGLKGAESHLQKATAPGVYGVIGAGAGLAASVLPKLIPIVNTISHGVTGIIADIHKLTDSKLFSGFLSNVQGFFKGFLGGAGPALTTLFGTLMHLFLDLRPAMSGLGTGIVALINKASTFVGTLSPAQVGKFVHGIETTVGPILSTLGSVLHALGSISVSLAPIRKPFLDFISSLAKGIAGLDFHDLAAGVGSVLHAISPLIPVAGDLLNAVIKPLSVFLKALSKDAITPLVHSLGKGLAPAFHIIQSTLTQLAPYLAKFVGSFTNLLNPTGVALFNTLIRDLSHSLVLVGPPLLQIGVLLESVIDSGLRSAMPLIDGVATAIGGMAIAAGLVLGPLVSLVTHFHPLLTVLGLALDAFVAFKIITAGTTAVTALAAVATAANTFALTAEAVAAGEARMAVGLLNVAMKETPWGAVLGVVALVAGGIMAVAGSFKHTEHAAALAYAAVDRTKAMKSATAAADLLYQSLNKVTGAYTATTRAAVRQSLDKIGTPLNDLLNAATAAGMSEGEVIDAITHRSKKAMTDLAVVRDGLLHANQANTDQITKLQALLKTHGVDSQGRSNPLFKIKQAQALGVDTGKLGAGTTDAEINRTIQAQIDKLSLLSQQAKETANSVHGLVVRTDAKLVKGWVNSIEDANTALGKLRGVSEKTFQAIPKKIRVALDQSTYHETLSGIAGLAGKWHTLFPNMSGNTALALAKVLVAQDPSVAKTYGNVKALREVLLGIKSPPAIHVTANTAAANSGLRTMLNNLLGIKANSHISTSVTTTHTVHTVNTGSGKGTGHARGGVTTGPMNLGDIVGDNVGKREAIIPLEKYDIPRRGDIAALMQAASNSASNGSDLDMQTLREIRDILRDLKEKTPGLADLANMSAAQLRSLIQAARAA